MKKNFRGNITPKEIGEKIKSGANFILPVTAPVAILTVIIENII